MFWHNFKNCISVILKAKVSLFWSLVFPMALATFMFVAFENIMEKDEMFKDINVAVVSEGEEGKELLYVLEELSEGDDKLIDIEMMTEEDAKIALKDENVSGIIYLKDASLMVNESSANASLLEGILSSYKQNEFVIKDILSNLKEAPDENQIQAIINDMMEETTFYTESSTTSSNQNSMYNYFYAIIAMSCLFSMYSSIGVIDNLQANSSGRGMRKCISPNSKIVFIISEFFAMLLVHFIVELLAFGYMDVILGIDFGNKYPAIILTLFVACMIGISMGIIIGSISKIGLNGKMGIATSISLVLSGMADLFAHGVKRLIELKVPIINRINPAALISDCFYSLNVYDDYSVFTQNIVIMVIESVVFILIAFLMVRSNKYASV